MKDWYVYIVRCCDDSLYVGIAIDVRQRVEKHNSGEGAKYTRSHRPVKLVRMEKYPTENEARKREAQIKGWSRVEKINLVRYGRPDGPESE